MLETSFLSEKNDENDDNGENDTSAFDVDLKRVFFISNLFYAINPSTVEAA